MDPQGSLRQPVHAFAEENLAMHDPAKLTATEAVRAMREGSLHPVDLMEACLERIAERELAVRAFSWFDADAARHAALVARPGALHGLPIGVKDVLDTADMPSEYGFANLAWVAASRRRRRRGLGARGRRRNNWQDCHHRVCHTETWSDGKPAQSEAYARRFQQRVCGGRGGLFLSARLRHADGRKCDPAGGILWRRGLQAELRHDQPLRHEAYVGEP
jgi:hypothetical protein